ncbi:hypothetical protein [Halarcobacter mediterraneus]|uniref:hypothetical protein n=1 Tax=Halarcobacter mediterraneus TaxID=2023153 RepID=UPI00100B703B|nr:hypothetical protein [Halarcobacter mediterraneus]
MAEKTDEEIIEELGLEQNATKQEEIGKNEEVDDSLEPMNESSQTEEELEISEEKQEENNQTIENEDFEDAPIQKKQSKLFRVLIGVIASLSVVLTIGIILYLTGFFEEETKIEQKKVAPIEVNKKDDSVNIEEIDKNKLNKKLQMLTKTEIMNKEELEAEEKRIAEEKRKEEEAKKKAIEEEKRKEEEKIKQEKEALEKEKELLAQRQELIKKEQEDFIKFQEEIKKEFELQKEQLLEEIEKQKNTADTSLGNSSNIDTQKPLNVNDIVNNTIQNQEENIIEEKDETSTTMNSKLFLPFINVATIKGNLYKSYLDQIETFDKKISLCRDSKNRIEIYFGPYTSSSERSKVFDSLLENGFKEAYLVDFTKEEYEKRCKY